MCDIALSQCSTDINTSNTSSDQVSIKNFSERVEGSGCKQMTPKLENKAFSVKSTQFVGLKRYKEPYNTTLYT